MASNVILTDEQVASRSLADFWQTWIFQNRPKVAIVNIKKGNSNWHPQKKYSATHVLRLLPRQIILMTESHSHSLRAQGLV
jgi:hypothetical protein